MTSNAYYTKWTSGIKGGGSGFQLFLEIENQETLAEKEIIIKGMYFRDDYSELDHVKNGNYKGFIKTSENSKSYDLTPKKENLEKEKQKEEIPFKLENDEAVIYFTEANKEKYFKIKLKEKTSLSQPM